MTFKKVLEVELLYFVWFPTVGYIRTIPDIHSYSTCPHFLSFCNRWLPSCIMLSCTGSAPACAPKRLPFLACGLWPLTFGHSIWHLLGHILWCTIWHLLWKFSWRFTWHSHWRPMWHIFWHVYFAFYLAFLSTIYQNMFWRIIIFGILSGIYSDILSYICSDILFDICSEILLDILFAILSGNLFGSHGDTFFHIQFGIPIWRNFWHYLALYLTYKAFYSTALLTFYLACPASSP